MNLGAYHPSHNPHGAAKFPDGNFWYNTTSSKTSKKDCFINQVGGTIASGISGRPDNRYADAIYAGGLGGVIDYRLSAHDMSSPEQAAIVDAKVKNGTYRGVEKLKFSYVHGDAVSSDFSPNSSTNNEAINYDLVASMPPSRGSYDTNLVGYLVGDLGTICRLRKWHNNGTRVTFSTITNAEFSSLIGSGAEVFTLVVVEDTNISVSGEFTQTDVIGDPVNILANPDLKDGWMGSWNPKAPNGQETPLIRKCADTTMESVLVTTDLGGSWIVGGVGLDIILNESSTIIGNNEYVMDYTAFAKQTKVANTEPVFNHDQGLGTVMAFNNYQTLEGALFGESLISKIITNASSRTGRSSALLDFKLKTIDFKLSDSTTTMPTHNPLLLSSNTGVVVKCLDYQVESNQQVSLNYAYEELIYDTDWGDNNQMYIEDGQTINTDDNGNTVLCGTNTLALPYGWAKNNI